MVMTLSIVKLNAGCILWAKFIREPLLKEKAQYSWLPCTNRFRLADFDISHITLLQNKLFNEEVNRTVPSLTVSVPWCHIFIVMLCAFVRGVVIPAVVAPIMSSFNETVTFLDKLQKQWVAARSIQFVYQNCSKGANHRHLMQKNDSDIQ